jgi:hypothetical protein
METIVTVEKTKLIALAFENAEEALKQLNSNVAEENENEFLIKK